jgi:uncharacterized protein
MSSAQQPTSILILPGIGNSGPAHWQSRWESMYSQDAKLPIQRIQRIHQEDWDAPHCARWVQSLELHVRDLGPGTVLVAHSLACLLVAHWAAQSTLAAHIRGALLVAVPDPQGPAFPKQAIGFDPLPMKKLPFASIQLASDNDPYSQPAFSRSVASAWGCTLYELGSFGHINASSNLGDWPQGWAYVQKLMS